MIYFDNAATTKVCDKSAAEIMRVLKENFGNPSSLHHLGVLAENEILSAAKTIKEILSADDAEIIFTSSGTEANNLAVLGAFIPRQKRYNEYVLDAANHDSVVGPAEKLSKDGFIVKSIAPLVSGSGDIDKIAEAVGEKTALVSLMLVNNETGSKTEVKSAVGKIRRKNPETLIHIDCVAAFCKEDINFKKLGADIITISAHKIHGPKGVGAIIYKKGIRLSPLLYGASGTIRPGTEATPLIAGFSAAASQMSRGLKENEAKVAEINSYIRAFLENKEGITVNSPKDASPYVLNFSTNKIKSEVLLHYLEENGIYVSSGSACSKGKNSHVLTAMGLKRESVLSAVRLSFSEENTLEEAGIFCECLEKAFSVLIKSF